MTGMFSELPIQKLDECKHISKREGKDDIEELMADISERGLLQPLLVRPVEGGQYEVYAGRRRLEALKKLGRPTAPCVIQKGIDDMGVKINSLSENLHRRPLSQVEKFQALHEVLRGDANIEEAARKAGVTKATVRAYTKMRESLDASLVKELDNKDVPMDVALALSKVEKEKQRPVLDECGPSSKAIREATKKTPLPKEPWVYDEHGEPLIIPAFLHGRVLNLVRQSMK